MLVRYMTQNPFGLDLTRARFPWVRMPRARGDKSELQSALYDETCNALSFTRALQ